MAGALFRNQHGAWKNVAALTYTLAGYALGLWLLTVSHWTLNLLGVLLTSHTLVYAAYFIHEFAHHHADPRTAGGGPPRAGKRRTHTRGASARSIRLSTGQARAQPRRRRADRLGGSARPTAAAWRVRSGGT
jgi:hypothetical protein